MNFYLMNELTGVESGPFTVAQIQEMVRSYKIKKNSLIRKGNSKQWERAAGVLTKLFDQAEAEKAEGKKQATQARSDAKRAGAQERATKAGRKAAQKRAKALESQHRAVQSREHSRGTLMEKIFGRLDPSPYWGFQIQAVIINISIGFVVLGTLVMFLIAVVGSIIALASSDSDFAVGGMVFVFGICYAVGILIWGFLTVVALVFFRNVIDWMIDMEGHAHALRNKLTNETT